MPLVVAMYKFKNAITNLQQIIHIIMTMYMTLYATPWNKLNKNIMIYSVGNEEKNPYNISNCILELNKLLIH